MLQIESKLFGGQKVAEKICILPKSQAHWELELLRMELRELKREQHHLRIKKLERPLTEWELQRTLAVLRETTEIIERFGDLNAKASTSFSGRVANLDQIANRIA